MAGDMDMVAIDMMDIAIIVKIQSILFTVKKSVQFLLFWTCLIMNVCPPPQDSCNYNLSVGLHF